MRERCGFILRYGIAMMGSDAEEHYTDRVAEVYDGYPDFGDVFLSQTALNDCK